MKALSSLIGRRFSKLTVVAPADPVGYNKRWVCRCDCGTEKIIYQNSLCQGATKSCGCYNKEASRKRMSRGWAQVFTKEFLQKEHIENKKSLREIAKEKGCTVNCIVRHMKKHNLRANDPFHNIAGKRFDMLKVIDMAYTKNGNSFWHVKCDCGTKKVVSGRSLVRHNIVSCGCWNRSKCWKGVGDLSKTYWSRVVKSAIDRGIEINISMNYAWQVFEEQHGCCALSGDPIVLDRQLSWHQHSSGSNQTASLDRIDSSRGYVIDNVQWIHTDINKMKMNLPESRFIEWCRKITEHQYKC